MLPKRFWNKVAFEPMSGCWLWTGATLVNGYGQCLMRDKVRYVHRLSYEEHVEAIPQKLVIDHLCRQRCCVNPEHMEVVTSRENTLRGVGTSAVNARRTHCKHGHPFDAENTQVTRRGRQCRACRTKYDMGRRAGTVQV